jgi:hypothetical protein
LKADYDYEQGRSIYDGVRITSRDLLLPCGEQFRLPFREVLVDERLLDEPAQLPAQGFGETEAGTAQLGLDAAEGKLQVLADLRVAHVE